MTKLAPDCQSCAAWPGTCPAHSTFWANAAGRSRGGGILYVEVVGTPEIAALVDRLARSGNVTATRVAASADDPRAAAEILAQAARDRGASLIVAPHTAAGCAIAALVAQRLDAALLSGCDELNLDENGTVKAIRSRYAGLVTSAARCPSGVIVATLHPRSVIETVPPMSPQFARRLLVYASGMPEATVAAARACADAIGALAVDVAAIQSKALAPDVCIVAGLEGNTEINSSLRGSRIVVAVVAHAGAPIAQIADYILAGDVEEHLRAIAGALSGFAHKT